MLLSLHFKLQFNLFFQGPDTFRLLYQLEEKDIVLKAESEKAKEDWTKHIWDAVISYTQVKRDKKRQQKEKEKCKSPVGNCPT